MRYLYRPVIRAVEWLADAVRPLQSGDVNLGPLPRQREPVP
jgi:hypothetical protein